LCLRKLQPRGKLLRVLDRRRLRHSSASVRSSADGRKPIVLRSAQPRGVSRSSETRLFRTGEPANVGRV
jgi:hypothetical protein